LTIVVVASAWSSPWDSDATGAPPAACTAASSWGTLQESRASRLLALVNAHRASIGLPPLGVSPALTDAAVWKARHMAEYGYLDGNDPAPPVARSFATRLSACGYPGRVIGEDLAQGYTDADGVVAAWLASPDLRAAIENRGFTLTGIAAARSGGGNVYWVEDFAGPIPTAPGAPRCVVPYVVGKTVTAATQSLKRARCSLGGISRGSSRSVPRGRVKTQSPRAGTVLAPQSPVNVVVSSGRRH